MKHIKELKKMINWSIEILFHLWIKILNHFLMDKYKVVDKTIANNKLIRVYKNKIQW